MNPVPDAQGLKLNVSGTDNALDLELAHSVAPYLRIGKKTADAIIQQGQGVVAQWPKIAASLRIPPREQVRLAPCSDTVRDSK